ncbi:MAG: hypothetical protein JNK34_01875 [Tabrizicola sp.]|nr:hypothetical protein [Tabrizicola sp.]
MRLPLAALALIALATAAYPLTPQLFPEITLTGGKAQLIPETDVTLLLTKVDDGRCPAGVECVWEGMIRAEITVTGPDGAAQEIVLCNQCDDATGLASAAGLTFGLVGLAPSTDELAKLGRAPELADYDLTVNFAPAE